MRCTACEYESSALAHFCPQCGQRLAASCPACKAPLPEDAAFCPGCGHRIREAPPAPHPPDAAATGRAEGERRQLTVMFCDLVGSTELGQRLDPEELGELLTTYQRVCSEKIEHYEGYVAQYLGDGILVYFGYPLAHENDAERAVRSGLAIQNALADLPDTETSGNLCIEARIGIHTGPVVVSEMGGGGERRETLAVGDTINRAARIQGRATAGSVLVSRSTLDLVPGLFVTEDLGPVTLKGLAEPVSLHRIVQQTGARGLVQLGSLTPLVGREQELGLLLDRWERAVEGDGQVVLLTGEAGVGKSRLLRAFRERLATRRHTWLDTECSPFATGAAFQPITELFARGLGFAEVADPAERLALLEGIELPGLEPGDMVPYLASLLQLPESERFPLPQVSTALQRERTLAALSAIYLGVAALQPVAFCVEDLHWSDPSTRELLMRMIGQAPTACGLIVLTGRPEAWEGWSLNRSHVSFVSLTRLTRRDARGVVLGALGDVSLPDDVIDRVVERADGVPLFLEELTKSVVENRMLGVADQRAIPMSLQDSLTARLDRLSSAKEVAQLAATLGREFSYELLEAVSDLDTANLRAGLAQLARAEIVYERGTPPTSTYQFKHALLQDTAYQSQLRSHRKNRHAQIADAIERRFPEMVEGEPERLAHHCAEAGLAERAAGHYDRAGKLAIERLANTEAIDYYRRGIAQLDTLAETMERHQLEITLRVGLGGPLAATQAYGSPDVTGNYARIRELAELVGEGPQQLAAWIGLVNYYSQSSAFDQLGEVARALVRIAEPLGITPLLALGKLLLGLSELTGRGALPKVVGYFEEVIALAEAGELPPPTSPHEPDMAAQTYGVASLAYIGIGDLGVARQTLQRGIDRAASLDHAATLCNVKILGCAACFQLMDIDGVEHFADEVTTLGTERGFRHLSTQADAYLGWLRALRGDGGGADGAKRAVAEYLSSGSHSTVAWLQVVSADALRLVGRYDECLTHLDASEAVIARTGEIVYLEWSQWIRALVQIERADDDAAAAQLREVLADGDQMAVKFRSALTLARLYERANRRAEAHELYERFVEPFASGMGEPLQRFARAAAPPDAVGLA